VGNDGITIVGESGLGAILNFDVSDNWLASGFGDDSVTIVPLGD